MKETDVNTMSNRKKNKQKKLDSDDKSLETFKDFVCITQGKIPFSFHLIIKWFHHTICCTAEHAVEVMDTSMSSLVKVATSEQHSVAVSDNTCFT